VDDGKWEQWSALGGIAFAVLTAITAFLPGTPPKTSDSAATMVKFVADHDGAIRWSAYLGALGVVALFWWLGSVWRLMRRTEGGSPRLAVVALSGAVFAAVMATVAGVILAVMPTVGTRTLGSSGTRIFYILSANLGIASVFGVAVFVGAFSALIIRSGVLPSLLGWVGALIALVALVGGAAVATTRDAIFIVAFGGFLAFLVWVLAVSILMLRGPQGSAASAT
jgi:hypothetical protein